MSKMIQVRNVSDATHRELKRRAKARGQTLTAYVEEILNREVSRPSKEDFVAYMRSREPIDLGDLSAAEIIREARREAGIDA
jgi:plasmid stability protein